MPIYDAIIVGAGPNGLAAAITLARAGRKVLVREAASTIGGGSRSAELTLPGFVHDVCAAAHPLGLASPFFRSLSLSEFGLEWIQPSIPVAHPFDDGTAAVLDRSLEATGDSLGADSKTYQRLMKPLVADWEKIMREFLGPLRFPRYPLAMTRFGLLAIWPARTLAQTLFRGGRARALFAGLAAHSIQPLERPPTAAFGFMLGILGHAVGWPVAKGGSQSIVNAMAAYLRSLSGEIVTDARVDSVDELPSARAVLFDVTPRQFLHLAKDRLPASYRNTLERYRYGPGAFKIDFALSEPIPWKAEACRRAGTVHLGGTLEEIAASESAVWRNETAERPYILLAQQSLFDCSRAPQGQHTAWAYCHVPHASTVDMTERIIAQIERFAPGFRDCILAHHSHSTKVMEQYNPNYIGGDITGGVQDFGQLFTRPTWHFPPYATPARGLYLCSASTPPGGGVHGMCGYFAAQTALRDERL
ncbi:MAG: NAD(P)/FAD-dependent oxidoreductase [Chloroflexi bacterium]|nr:NAD(P)/FAD-dependent oxidoreductase [Chloroflexota bacterium]